MFLEKYGYRFMGRMRRPEGLAPKVRKDERVRTLLPHAQVFEASLALSLAIVICAFVFFPRVEVSRQIAEAPKEFVKFDDVALTRQEARPPAPPRPAIPIEAPTDEMVEDIALASSELDVAAEVAPPPPPPQGADSEEESYFVVVEEMPQIVGGMEAIISNLVYPDIALRAGVKGRVFVLAYVDESGSVVKAQVTKGIGAGCDEAAVDAVKKATFVPGKQRGRPVRVKVVVPIRFDLTT